MTHTALPPAFASISVTASSTQDTEVTLQVQGLYKHYGQLTALRGIDFSVHQGEIFGLIGPDGAGKTTTFHILSGVMAASAGTVTVLNRPPREDCLKIGYLTQQFSLYLDLTIDENLRHCAGIRGVSERVFAERRAYYLHLMELEQFSDRLAGHLSGGMKQKLALCCVLITQPRILLLDEPTTGVDPVSRREFWDILATVARGGMTVVVATPYLDEAERCDRIALIYEGQIQQIGTLPELRSSLGLHRLELRPENLEAVQQILIQHKTELQTKEQLVEHCLEAKSNGEQQPIVDIQTFGDRLDVLVKDVEAGKAKIHQLLTDQALPLDAINPAATTLENIFVARLRQQRSDPPYVAFPRSRGGNQQWVVESKTPASAVAIAAQNLRKTFGHFQAVKGVNLDIRYGEIYGLLGANGAGKTTTIKMLCGLVQPSSGSVALAGQSRDLRNQEVRRRIGYMSQKFTLYDDLSILQNLEFYCRVYGVPRKLRREKIDWVLASCDLVGREQMLTKQLPGGWKQRVAFGASVMHEPEILFLDEPTSGVDPLARRQFWHLINDFARQGTAVLVTTHYLEEAEHCNRMGFMVDGQIAAQGSPSEIKAAQPGQLIELVVDRPQETAHLLKMQFAPWQVAIFGDRLHLVLDHPEQDLPQVSNLLQSAHLSMLSLRSIPFSLEDAFIGIVQRAKTRNLWD